LNTTKGTWQTSAVVSLHASAVAEADTCCVW
jgi:hypothetical protein